MKHFLRSFFLGFIPAICLFGLIAGLCAVWVNTQSVLTPASQPFSIEERLNPENGKVDYCLAIFGEETRLTLPKTPDKLEIFSRYPVLLPRSIRLIAFAGDWLKDFSDEYLPHATEYLREHLTILYSGVTKECTPEPVNFLEREAPVPLKLSAE